MKNKMMGLLAILCISTSAAAQQKSKRIKPWVCDQGFWVAEGNAATPKQHTVRFYTSSGQLMYEEKVNGKRLNTDRRKTWIRLKKALDTVLLAYRENRPVPAQSLAVL